MRTYSHAIPIEHNLPPGPLWPWKHTMEELELMDNADSYTQSAQYKQAPTKRGGSVFLTEWWDYYSKVPEYEYKAIFGDTALKDGEIHDYTVFQCWAKYQGRIYLLDVWRGKIKSTELEKVFIDFWNRNVSNPAQPLRVAYIEDKASGTQLIQKIQKNGGIPIVAVQRNKSKVERAWNLNSWVKSGLCVLPEDAPWLNEYITEHERFSPMMTHAYDDQVDCTLDAIEKMLILNQIYKKPDNDKKSSALAPGKKSKLW